MNEDDDTLIGQLNMLYNAFLFYNGPFADIFEVHFLLSFIMLVPLLASLPLLPPAIQRLLS